MHNLPPASDIARAPTRAGGDTFISAHPNVADWLDGHPDVADLLSLGQRASTALAAVAEGALAATNGTRAALDDAKAAKASYVSECDLAGRVPDATRIERLDTAIARARASHDDADGDATAAAGAATAQRGGFMHATKLVNDIAASGSDIEPSEDITLPKGDARDLVAAQRKALEALDEEERNVKRAPIPEADALDAVAPRLLATAQPMRAYLGEGGKGITLYPPLQNVHLASGEVVQTVDVVALLTSLFPEKMVEAAQADLRARYANVELTLDAPARAAALKGIAERRLAAERVEVAGLVQLWRRGDYVPLRPQTDPMVFLGIEAVIKPSAPGAGSLVNRLAQGAGSLVGRALGN